MQPIATSSQPDSAVLTLRPLATRTEIGIFTTNPKADSADKQQAQANADSVERNLTAALPGMISAVRTAPQDMAANFKLYRNMNALYDVMKTLTEASAAFGQKQDYQTLAQYADAVDG